MSDVLWCDPPPSKLLARTWAYRLRPVMERPGVWALVADHFGLATATSTVSKLRSGATVTPPGCWEFQYGRHEGKWGVWARYLGEED